jgi:hypothetical protein
MEPVIPIDLVNDDLIKIVGEKEFLKFVYYNSTLKDF